MKRLLICVALLAVSLSSAGIGYWWGAKWANMESYKIGFDLGYNTGLSDGTIPGAVVVELKPDGTAIQRTNPSVGETP